MPGVQQAGASDRVADTSQPMATSAPSWQMIIQAQAARVRRLLSGSFAQSGSTLLEQRRAVREEDGFLHVKGKPHGKLETMHCLRGGGG